MSDAKPTEQSVSVSEQSVVNSAVVPSQKKGNKTAIIVVVVILILCACCSLAAVIIGVVLPSLGVATFLSMPNSVVIDELKNYQEDLENSLNDDLNSDSSNNSDNDSNNQDENNDSNSNNESVIDDLLGNWGEADLPDNFPSDIPIYQGAKVYMSYASDGTTVVGFMVDASTADVYRFYKDQFENAGWDITSSYSYSTLASLTAEKSSREVSMSVAGTEGEVTQYISISYKE